MISYDFSDIFVEVCFWLLPNVSTHHTHQRVHISSTINALVSWVVVPVLELSEQKCGSISSSFRYVWDSTEGILYFQRSRITGRIQPFGQFILYNIDFLGRHFTSTLAFLLVLVAWSVAFCQECCFWKLKAKTQWVRGSSLGFSFWPCTEMTMAQH